MQTSTPKLNKKTLILIVIMAAIIISPAILWSVYYYWPKKDFYPVSKPTALILRKPHKTIEILKQPLKRELLEWNNSQIRALHVEGYLRVDFKSQEYFFVQLSCPSQLKCSGAKAYVPLSLTYELDDSQIPYDLKNSHTPDLEKTEFFLIASAPVENGEVSSNDQAVSSDDVLNLRDWLYNESKPIPEYFNKKLFEFYLAGLDEKERDSKIASLFYLSKSYQEKIRNPQFVPFLNQFGDIQKINLVLKNETAQEAKISPKQDQFLIELAEYTQDEFQQVIDRYFDEFPAMASQHPNLKSNLEQYAHNFNTELKLPLFKEYFFNKLLTSSQYEYSINTKLPSLYYKNHFEKFRQAYQKTNPAASLVAENVQGGSFTVIENDQNKSVNVPQPEFKDVSLIFDYEFGAILKWQDNHKSHESILRQIKAVPNDINGIGFEIQSDELGTLILTSQKLAATLDNLDSDKMKRYIAQIGDLESILAEKDFKYRAMLLSLKFGKPDRYDSQKRNSVYSLDTKAYPMILALMKSHPNINESSTDVYSGEADNDWGNESSDNGNTTQLRWYQKYDKSKGYKSLHISGTLVICERGCFDEQINITCFDSYSNLKVHFPMNALEDEANREKIQITAIMNLDDTYNNSYFCNSVWPNVQFQSNSNN